MNNYRQIIILFFSIILFFTTKSFCQQFEYIDTINSLSNALNLSEMTRVQNSLQYIDTLTGKSQIINLNKRRKYNEFQVKNDGYSIRENKINIWLFIDTSKIISTPRNWQGYIPPPMPSDLTLKFSSDTNIIGENNNSSDMDLNKSKNKLPSKKEYQSFYPVYIINKSDSTVMFYFNIITGFIMIQEALDSSGIWKPIQYWENVWCSICDDGVNVKSNYFALTRMPIFTGTFKTKIRLKLKLYNDYYYSNEIHGSINYSQFDFPSNEFEYYDDDKKNRMLLK